MCRNDKKLLKYELRLDLFDVVIDEDSILEESSVGRVFVTLAKAESPAKWKRLLADNSLKPQNMGVWWELWEKYEKELEKHDPEDGDESDEESDSDDVVITGGSNDNGSSGDGTEAKPRKRRSKNKDRKKESMPTSSSSFVIILLYLFVVCRKG